mgnify:CR=1 FL=1
MLRWSTLFRLVTERSFDRLRVLRCLLRKRGCSAGGLLIRRDETRPPGYSPLKPQKPLHVWREPPGRRRRVRPLPEHVGRRAHGVAVVPVPEVRPPVTAISRIDRRDIRVHVAAIVAGDVVVDSDRSYFRRNRRERSFGLGSRPRGNLSLSPRNGGTSLSRHGLHRCCRSLWTDDVDVVLDREPDLRLDHPVPAGHTRGPRAPAARRSTG